MGNPISGPNSIGAQTRTFAIQPHIAAHMRMKFDGAFMGAAVGDSFGMAVETLSRVEIAENFGRIDKLMGMKTRAGFKQAGSWTDETFMTMVTTKSILDQNGINIDHLTSLFIDGLDCEFGHTIAGTTRRALELRSQGMNIDRLKNGRHSGGGAAARMAPIAMYSFRNLDELRVNAEAAARITHSDNDAVAAAVAVAMTIGWALRGELELNGLVPKLIDLMKDLKSNLAYTFETAGELLEQDIDAIDGIDEIGSDGASVRLIPSAIYAFLKTPTRFDQTIIAAVNAGGDTDTRAAIAGAISGAYNTITGVPTNYWRSIQDHKTIMTYADRLFNMVRFG